MPTRMGARSVKARGTKRLTNSRTATRTSTADTTFMYPAFINVMLTVMMSCGMSLGTGMKFKKPLRPKIRNINPNNTRAMGGKKRVKDFFSVPTVPVFVSIGFSFSECFVCPGRREAGGPKRSAARHGADDHEGFFAFHDGFGQ